MIGKQFFTHLSMMRRFNVLLLAAMVLWGGCGRQTKKDDRKEYKTLSVKTESVILKSDYPAKFTGKQIVEIRPQISGTITRICINEGDRVRKGQTLFVIDQVPYEAALKQAEANVRIAEAKLATAKLNLESCEDLNAGQIVGDYQVRTARNAHMEAEASLAQAKAQLVNARNNLSYTIVKSPVDGTAGMIPYHAGALVSSSIADPLVTVSDDADIYAYFSITEAQAMDIMEQYGSMEQFMALSPDVELKLSNGKSYPFKGRVNAVSGIVDVGTGAVTMRAVFPNENRLLHNGGSGTVVIPTKLDSCIVIPQTATYELQNKVFVYKVVDNATEATSIDIFRLNNGTEYVVKNGLQPGDVIIAEGAGLVKNGIEIKVKK